MASGNDNPREWANIAHVSSSSSLPLRPLRACRRRSLGSTFQISTALKEEKKKALNPLLHTDCRIWVYFVLPPFLFNCLSYNASSLFVTNCFQASFCLYLIN